ncbi:MAG: hypothetical protein IJ112_03945 [Oscillospiraceae bacterium]|nr:hypothetical protein [Oscillospiraceae bacterium]
MKYAKRTLCAVLAVVMFVGCMSLFGCSSSQKKTAMDFDAAVEKMEDAGLEVTVLDDSVLTEGYERACYAQAERYIAEFYKMESFDRALQLQEDVMANVLEGETVSADVAVSGENYAVEHFTANGKYYAVSVIDDTALLVYGNEDAKDLIKDFAESFGYN